MGGEIGTDTSGTVCADLAENGTPYNENVASGLKLWPEAQRCVKDSYWLTETTEEASQPIGEDVVVSLRVGGQDDDSCCGNSYLTIRQTCIQGCCDCKHVVGDAQVRFKPCRAFVKALLGDAVDKVWEYIVKGAFFGFEVINKDYAVEYSCDNYNSVMTGHNYNLMSRKLRADLDKECLTVVGSSPWCVHALGCVPKGDGIRGIADC